MADLDRLQRDHVTCEITVIVWAETEKALLVDHDGQDVTWVPKSLCHFEEQRTTKATRTERGRVIVAEKPMGTLTIAQWFAEKEGMV